jgi:hypothetical protein
MNIILGIILLAIGIILENNFAKRTDSFNPEYDDWFTLYLIAQCSTFAIFFGIILLIS